MKTKIILFITLLVALLSVFAFTVSAEVPEWTAMQYIDEMADKATFGADGTKATATSRVMLAHEVTDETTGEITTVYTTYPAYYVVKNSTAVGFSFTEINNYTGDITYAAKNVVRIEFPNGTLSTPEQVLKPDKGFTALQTVVFPQGFTTIGQYTFKNNDNTDKSSLVSVEIPSTVTSIGQQAFYRCYYLTSLVIPEGVTEIPTQMAYYTKALENLVLPSTLKTIGSQAFYYAGSAEGVSIAAPTVIPEGCTTIGDYAFKFSGVTDVSIPSTLESVGIQLFMSCPNLTTVTCSSKTIGDLMFSECPALQTVTLYNTVTIGDRAFFAKSAEKSSITSFNLPDTVTSIDDFAFARSKVTSIVVPAGVTTLGDGVFKESKSLESAVVLGSITGSNMFYGCTNLSKLVFTEKFDTLGSSAFGYIASSSTIFYTGSDYERMKTLLSSLNRVSQAKFSSYESYKAGTHTTGTYMFIYDANLCEVGFDSNHVYTGNITPTFKGQKFLSSCDFGDFCTRCNQGQIVETLPALFINKGYAYSGDSMLQGFAVNRELLSEYEGYLGNIKFGLVAAYCGTGAGFDTTDGELITATGEKTNAKIAAVDFTSRSYDLFEMKITGLTESHKQTSFYINAYIIEGGKVYYIDNDQTTDTAVAKSHNEIVAIVESKK